MPIVDQEMVPAYQEMKLAQPPITDEELAELEMEEED